MDTVVPTWRILAPDGDFLSSHNSTGQARQRERAFGHLPPLHGVEARDRRLAALSSLFKHLVRHGEAARNPVAEIKRPAINRYEGTTLAFKTLDAPAEDTVAGLRDRALLSVGLRRAEIAALTVGDLHHDSLRVVRKAAGATRLPSTHRPSRI